MTMLLVSIFIISICCAVIVYYFIEQIENLKKRVRYLEERNFANTDTLKKVCDYLRKIGEE